MNKEIPKVINSSIVFSNYKHHLSKWGIINFIFIIRIDWIV